MAVFLRGGVYWYKFRIAGQEIRESAKTSRRTVAVEAERVRRLEVEKAFCGIPLAKREDRIRTVRQIVADYSKHYTATKRAKSAQSNQERMKHVTRILGARMVGDLSEDTIRGYIQQRLKEGVSGRTVNLELGQLSRAIGRKWSVLWPNVKKLEERTDIGKALPNDEEVRLLAAADDGRSTALPVFVRIALLTAMRSGEIAELQWDQIDLANHIITVGIAKTKAGTGRQIPINAELLGVIQKYRDWYVDRFGAARPEWYAFPFGSPVPNDPTKPTTTVKTAWNTLRRDAKVQCRLHDLRHTALTKMAEAGASEHTMKAIAGHMSRVMLERYSHIRMAAKREVMSGLSTAKKAPAKDDEGTKMGTIPKFAKLRRVK